MTIRDFFKRFSDKEISSFVPAYLDDEIRISWSNLPEKSTIELDENMYLLLMQTKVALSDNGRYLYISYDDVYDLYYEDDGNIIDYFKLFNLPELFNGYIKISNLGNYLETDEVKYSFEFNDGMHPAIKRVKFNILTVDGEYKLLPRELYDCLKKVIQYNMDSARNQDTAEQFQLLALIKDYAEKANLALNERLRIENKPIVIDKIKIDFEQTSNGLEIKPWIDNQDKEFNNKFLSAFDRNADIRSFYSIKDNVGNDIKVILKNQEAARKLKRNRVLTGDKERDFFRGINEVLEDDSFDLSLYGDRVIGYGYLNYRANDSISSDNDESWFDTCNTVEYPSILTNENKIRLYPEDIPNLQNKLVEMEAHQSNTTELEFNRDGGINKLILTKEEIGNEILKLQKAICGPERIKSKKALREIQQIIKQSPNQEYVEYNGHFIRNSGLDYIGTCIDALEHTKNKGDARNKALIIHNSLEDLKYTEPVSDIVFESELKLPRSITVNLFEHQKAGIQRLQGLYNTAKKNGFLLADDMGLGKTIQILTFLAGLKELDQLGPSLVVAPTILLNIWDNPDPLQPGEIQKFLKVNTFDTYRIQGTIQGQLKQNQAQEIISRSDIVFTTYDSLRLNHVWLGKIKWKVIVCDEIQYAKNPRTLVSNAVKAQNAEFKIACSATPIENSTEDLWNIMDFSRPGILGSLADFRKKFVKPLSRLNNTDIHERSQINEELVKIIGPSFMRRSKEDQLKDLPAKRVIVDSIQMNTCEIRKMMELNQLRSQGEVALPLIQKMVALCSHPRLIQDHNPLSLSAEVLINESSKLKYLQGILSAIQPNAEKVVIFTRFKNMQTILAKAILNWFGIRPLIINGDVSADKRSQFISQFKKSSGFNVIILSPEAAGVGITVTEANHVIHYTRLWNPAKEAQATDRAYRIGQEKEVCVYYPISSYDTSYRKYFDSESEYIDFFLDKSTAEKTPEEKLNRLLVRKKRMLNSFFLAAGDFNVDMVKEWDEEKANPNQITMKNIDLLRANEFEVLCSLLYSKMGYRTYLTVQSGDYGVDVVVEKDGNLGLVQSKLLRQECLSREALNDVIGAKSVYSETIGSQVNQLIVMSTADRVTDSVNQVAGLNNVDLLLKPDIESMLIKYPIYYSEIQFENNDRYSLERLRYELNK